MRTSRRGRQQAVVVVTATTSSLVAFAAAASVGAVASAATIVMVDGSSPACTDAGTGLPTAPFCTITAAATKAKPGHVVTVAAGTYGGDISPGTSGQSGLPIVFTPAVGATVVVTGGTYGFRVVSRSFVEIDNFVVRGTANRGIYVSSSSDVTVRGNQVTGTAGEGIYASSSTRVTVTGNDVSTAGQPVEGSTRSGIVLTGTVASAVTANVVHANTDSGIALKTGADGDTVSGNTTFANARGWQRAAAGIDVRTEDNIVSNNTCYGNEDSGLQFYPGAARNVVTGNLSYSNGDHGIDDLNAPNQVVTSNTVVGNVTSGINFEGTSAPASSGARVENNVAVDNGIGSTRTSGNIRVDTLSIPGTSVDWNLGYLSRPGNAYTWGVVTYRTLATFRAAVPTQQVHGVEADPRFAAAAAGNFQLSAGSPAIDAADSGAAGETSVDSLGRARVDDPATANTGTGPRTYDDMGALEYRP